MNWILDNLQLVIIVASAFAWWLTQRRQSSRGDSPPDNLPEEPPMDADERTRRIQEEIRRRIAERQAEAAGRTAHEPPPLVLAPAPTVQRPLAIPPPLRRTEPDWSQDDAAMLERQRKLEEQVRALDAQRRAARADVPDAFELPASVLARRASAATLRGDRDLTRVLRDRRSLRQAMVLREVLGPPVALREQQ